MYVFGCLNGHKSYSASIEQKDSSCPECGEPTHLIVEGSRDPIEKVFSEETSKNWSSDQDINVLYLRTVLNYMSDKLKNRGHLFLNEVFDELGLPRTRKGQLVGWTYSPDQPKKRYWEMESSSEETTVLLKFFPEGEIIDKIEESS